MDAHFWNVTGTLNWNRWKGEFSLFGYQIVKQKIAEFEAILGRRFQSPDPRNKLFLPGVMVINPRVFCVFFILKGQEWNKVYLFYKIYFPESIRFVCWFFSTVSVSEYVFSLWIQQYISNSFQSSLILFCIF